MIKVSVIIPVYNGEKHLRQCLDSVCNQTLRDIEIICVDDGSTDSSLEILQEYQQKDSRVQIYQQQNKYAGAARNLGKSHATGEYLVFWDCDDFFELETLEIMYQNCIEQKLDICVCGGYEYWNNLDKRVVLNSYLDMKRVPEQEVFNRSTNEYLILNFTNEAAWNKMFRSDFVKEQQLDFQAIRTGNDVYFTAMALCLADRIGVVDRPLINYRKGQEGSLVGTMTKSPLAPFQAWMDVAHDLIEKGAFPERSFANKAVSACTYLLRRIKTKEALYETLEFLKDGGFEKLHIKKREEGFYNVEWHDEFANHLLEDSIEDIQMYLFNLTYDQWIALGVKRRITQEKLRSKTERVKTVKSKYQKLKERNEKLKQENEKLRESNDVLEKELDNIKKSWLYRFIKK